MLEFIGDLLNGILGFIVILMVIFYYLAWLATKSTRTDARDAYEELLREARRQGHTRTRRRSVSNGSTWPWWRILGVAKDASEAEIKTAYRTLAKKLHPDLHKNKDKRRTERLMRINNAYKEGLDHIRNNRLR